LNKNWKADESVIGKNKNPHGPDAGFLSCRYIKTGFNASAQWQLVLTEQMECRSNVSLRYRHYNLSILLTTSRLENRAVTGVAKKNPVS
jgi:hypothetical protein